MLNTSPANPDPVATREPDRSFYTRTDVVAVAKDLLGKVLTTRFSGCHTSGIICETEAYAGITDRASHAYGGRHTPRTAVMYAVGGTAYIYLCYGIHSLFNVVTGPQGLPHAVLIRGILPLEGLGHMAARTGRVVDRASSGIGPGRVSQLLGLHYSQSGTDLLAAATGKDLPEIGIEDRGWILSDQAIVKGPRIGVAYAGPDAGLPYRFLIDPAAMKKGAPWGRLS